jgi:hypothetical protein
VINNGTSQYANAYFDVGYVRLFNANSTSAPSSSSSSSGSGSGVDGNGTKSVWKGGVAKVVVAGAVALVVSIVM